MNLFYSEPVVEIIEPGKQQAQVHCHIIHQNILEILPELKR
jgi:hypothetical protein